MCFHSWAIYHIYLFFEQQFQLISVCLERSIAGIFLMKHSFSDHFVSVELCSIYYPTIIVFWRNPQYPRRRCLSMTNGDCKFLTNILNFTSSISFLKMSKVKLIRYEQTFHKSLVRQLAGGYLLPNSAHPPILATLLFFNFF